jgi:ATP-dependent 26S proteasome regulatory subunit
MNAQAQVSWHELNQQYLMRAVRAASARLRKECHAASELDGENPSPPAAIEQLSLAFGLSRFERDLLLLCAGVELDASIAAMVASLQQRACPAPTFGLALAALPEAHWSALSPAGPLRRWRLIEVGGGDALTSSPLRIDERILHYLAGVPHVDERLRGMLERVEIAADVSGSQQAQAESIARAWLDCEPSRLPLIQICGGDSATRREVAAAACSAVCAELYAINALNLPHHAIELDGFARLWQREAALTRGALLIELAAEDPACESAIAWLRTQVGGLLLVSEDVPRRIGHRATFSFEIRRPTRAEQQALWRQCLGASGARLNGKLDVISAQFDLDAAGIRQASALTRQQECSGEDIDVALWEACREQTRPKVAGLAERIAAAATWDDLVLPPDQLEVLREVALQVRHRARVYDDWGFAARSTRGLGIATLFVGPSGTGKTMAAEVLANELRLDLYRIDLSQVISKYIGETEKNLRRVFDAAERGCSILLFDEADALFGKRSEVKDSHDRYANVEISYLLQRMEAYSGLAILTTNLQGAIDTAFLRRLRFVVQFPFPDAAQRAEIWRRAFPSAAPTEGLDFARLARLQLAGGNIRNISLQAAFLAANGDEPVRMSHLLKAARSEYAKLDRPLTLSETGDWR